MSTKSIILSSSGLQNLTQNTGIEHNDFCFIFGKRELRMNSIFAEFISPTVSRLHKTDYTINSIQYDKLFSNDSKILIEEIFTEDSLSLLQKISSGFPIEINKEQGFNMQLISIIINNDELFDVIDKIYPFEINEANVDYYLQYLQVFHYFLGNSQHFNYSKIIEFISSHFYSIDENKLLHLPKPILHSIISNSHLKIKNEDSFLDFINRIFSIENDQDKVNLSIIDFYEKVEFLGLSESKFQEFLIRFEFDDMTTDLWRKLCQIFMANFGKPSQKVENRYLKNFKTYKYDEKLENNLRGIIHHLTAENGGNVDSLGVVKVTSSTVYNDHHPKTVVDFDDIQHFFESNDKQNSWIKFDFLKRKVKPTHYSIRSRNAGRGSRHLKSWVVEGSNTNSENDWSILDYRNEVSDLDGKSVIQAFDIQNKLNENESFRYLRVRQTGYNTSNDNFMTMSALEFFGVVEY